MIKISKDLLLHILTYSDTSIIRYIFSNRNKIHRRQLMIAGIRRRKKERASVNLGQYFTSNEIRNNYYSYIANIMNNNI